MKYSQPFVDALPRQGFKPADQHIFKDFKPVTLLILHDQKKIFATVSHSLFYLHIKAYLAFLIHQGYGFEMKNDKWPIYVAIRQQQNTLTAKIFWAGDIHATEIPVCENTSIFSEGKPC